MTAKKVQFWQLFAQKTEEKRVLGCYKKKSPVNIKRAKKIIWTVIVKKNSFGLLPAQPVLNHPFDPLSD
jgi:hypothetical protein